MKAEASKSVVTIKKLDKPVNTGLRTGMVATDACSRIQIHF